MNPTIWDEAFENWWSSIYGDTRQRSHKSLAKKAWLSALRQNADVEEVRNG